MLLKGQSPTTGKLVPRKLPNNPLTSCSLMNFDFLPPQSSIFCFKSFGFLLSVFFYTSSNKTTLSYM